MIASSSSTAADSDLEVCAELTRRHARTFSAASHFLPSEKRRAAFAVYAFCRVADDFADAVGSDVGASKLALDRHAEAFERVLKGRTESAPFRELAWAMERYGIPAAPFRNLVLMLRNDLAPFEYTTWSQLEAYCAGVASTVGEMCAHVFGLPAVATARADALHDARTLGVALQLTNILRDVGEDAERNRCYLPTEDLDRFGILRVDIISRRISPTDDRFRRLMQFEIARTRALYQQAEAGLDVLERDSQVCARICAWGYAAILRAIELRDYDTLSGRSRVNSRRKLLIMLRAWRQTKLRARGSVVLGGQLQNGEVGF